MASSLVSVIVPVYAGERFLGDALDSVAAQSYPNLETIVVDDGSPDASAEIAARRPGVRLLREPHRGVAAARNAGVRAARGELIAFLDQDDLWEPSKLALQVEMLDARPDLHIVLSHVEMVLTEGTPRPSWLTWMTDRQPGYLPSTWLVRRDAFEQVGPFDGRYRMVCDADWLARAKDAGLANEMLAERLVYWRIHGANGSYEQAGMRAETFRMLRETVERQRQSQVGHVR